MLLRTKEIVNYTKIGRDLEANDLALNSQNTSLKSVTVPKLLLSTSNFLYAEYALFKQQNLADYAKHL